MYRVTVSVIRPAPLQSWKEPFLFLVCATLCTRTAGCPSDMLAKGDVTQLGVGAASRNPTLLPTSVSA